MEPLVSILIPAYNSQEWISGAIQSALGQTWPRKEVVIVDDGSTDQTFRVAQRFASKTLQVITQPNQGASAARNAAFALCQGDYVQWLDADDLLAPDKVETHVRALSQCATQRTLLSGAWAYFRYRQRKAQFLPTRLWCDLTPVEWLIRKMGENLHMQTDNWLVSRELTNAAGPWDTRLWRDNDGEYLCRVILASDGVKFVPEAKSYYRQAGYRSISTIGRSNKKLESLLRSMKLHIGYLRSLEDSDRTRAACLHYIRVWLHEFYPHRLDLVEELKRITSELGGRLEEPRLSWKYQWLVKLFGWDVARRAQTTMPQLKATALIAWDRACARLEGTRNGP